MEIIPDPYHVALLSLPFLVTVFGLYFILWAPLLEWLEERETVTETAKKEAGELEQAAEEHLTRIEARLIEARQDASKLRQEARERALAKEADILAEARSKAEAEVEVAVAQVQKERDEAREALRTTAKELSTTIAARVLGRELA